LNYCITCNEARELKLALRDKHGKNIFINIDAYILEDCRYDIILGIGSIRRYNLTQHLSPLFLYGETDIEGIENQMEVGQHMIANIEEMVPMPPLGQSERVYTSQKKSPIASSIVSKPSEEITIFLNNLTHENELVHDIINNLTDKDNDVFWKDDLVSLLPDDVEDKEPLSLPQITGEGSFFDSIRELVAEYSDIFSQKISRKAANITPMKLQVHRANWEVNSNRGPPRPQTVSY
jgi:hypothetical protein